MDDPKAYQKGQEAINEAKRARPDPHTTETSITMEELDEAVAAGPVALTEESLNAMGLAKTLHVIIALDAGEQAAALVTILFARRNGPDLLAAIGALRTCGRPDIQFELERILPEIGLSVANIDRAIAEELAEKSKRSRGVMALLGAVLLGFLLAAILT